MDKETKQDFTTKSYKSPKRKLIRFFEKSRNKWKDKCRQAKYQICRQAKYQIKLLRNRIRYLEKSKTISKNRVKALEAELEQMKSNEKQLVEEIERLKKRFILESQATPCFHTYSTGHAFLFIMGMHLTQPQCR
jgi:septation ring formation regulator EzrA